jgi:dihydropteroate synthase
VARAFEIEAEGADLLDIGGESTRPGSKAVSLETELERVLPVLERLRGRLRIPISIDTTKSAVARAAIDCGAEIINDISGLRFDASLAEIAAESGAGLVLMHSRATPEIMQRMAPVEDIFAEVSAGWRASIEQALRGGVKGEQLILDPGIGFGKTAEQNLQLINGLDRLASPFNLPVLLGPSRKSFIQRTLDQWMSASQRNAERESLAGTAASITVGVLRGARIVRVHDTGEMVALVRLVEAMMAAG